MNTSTVTPPLSPTRAEIPVPDATIAFAAPPLRTVPVPAASAAAPALPLTPSAPPNADPVQGQVELAKQALSEKAVTNISSVVGRVEMLSDTELITYMACEETIKTAWSNSLDVGRALATIRDQELYRVEYDSFAAYYRAKWELEHTKVYYLITIAEICTRLANLPGARQPDRESQVRPLITLTPDHAAQAWQSAVVLSGDREITGRIVKRAIRELGVAPAKPKVDRKQLHQERTWHRQAITDSIGQLLRLISQKATHELLLQHVEKINLHFQRLFAADRKHKKPSGRSS